MLYYFSNHYMDLLRALVEHVEMCAAALFLAFLLALPIGYWLAHTGKGIADGALSLLGVMYSIPSMGLLVLLVPNFGLGSVSAIIALVIYAQFSLIRSILLGFRNIESELLEAGKGMGLTPLQILLRLEFPLILPTIIGGLRVAAASVISIASMAAWINAGGLGTILFEGIYQNHLIKILWGTLLIVGLALLVEWILLDIEKHALQEVQKKVGSEL